MLEALPQRSTTRQRLLCLLPALLYGCSTSATGSAPDASVQTPPPRTLEYAFTSLTIDESTSATAPHTGFNVDGRYSSTPLQAADCDHGDFFSALDPDQNENGCVGGTSACRGGVDNQFPELATSAMMLIDMRQQLDLGVAYGTLALLMRVEGVNDLTNDADVIVTLYNGYPTFAACSNIGTPGQSYAISQFSLTTDGSPRYRFAASIRGRRLWLHPQFGNAENVFVLPFPYIVGFVLRPPQHAFNLRVTLTEDRGTDGNLGGYILSTDLLSGLDIGFGSPVYSTVLRNLVNDLIDVQTMNDCALPHGGIGMGMGFALTRAVIQPTPITASVPGMCGSP